MKHSWKATLIVLVLFLLTQIIGLAVVKTYTVGWQLQDANITKEIPYGFAPPEVQPEVSLISIMVAIIIATMIILLLGRIKANLIIKLWFTFVVLITMAVALSAIPFVNSYIALGVSALLTYFKIFRRHLVVHNVTELFIYPGLAAIFVPILNVGVTILLLLFLSVYDFWAVFKSKHMIELAKYQMNELKVFTGFFLPYFHKKDYEKVRKLREMQKKMKLQMQDGKGKKGKGKLHELAKKIKVNIAILGGGDVAFPLIFAGVVLKTYNSFFYGLIIAVFATLALLWLLTTAKKGKFYPAMPFISTGCLIGYGLVWLLAYLF
ncbi:MAG: hypothetical protein KJ767_04020 [Nanoarchaeota archaeon]|nr:hypothetical protein [Nanoarchaeota archaeon]